MLIRVPAREPTPATEPMSLRAPEPMPAPKPMIPPERCAAVAPPSTARHRRASPSRVLTSDRLVGVHKLRLHRCASLPPPLMCECAYPLCRRGLPPRRLASQARPLLVGISAPINAARRRPCDTPPRQRATSSARAAAACCASAAYLCRPHRCACVRASHHRLPPQPTRRVCVHLVAVCDSTARPYAAPLPRRYQAPQRVPSPRIAISLPRLCVRAPRAQIMLRRTPPQLGAGALRALVSPYRRCSYTRRFRVWPPP